MFREIISRDNGCPWGTTGLTSATWLNIPTEWVMIHDLIATQPGVLLHALNDAVTGTFGGDPLPHVVSWGGLLYLEDGHHRTVRARLAGQDRILARVLYL